MRDIKYVPLIVAAYFCLFVLMIINAGATAIVCISRRVHLKAVKVMNGSASAANNVVGFVDRKLWSK